MKIVGFDASVAEAHGYVIRTNAAGLQHSVKTSAAPKAIPHSQPIEYGNCGDPYIYYKYAGRRSKAPHYQAT